MSMILTRDDIAGALLKWQAGELTAPEVHRWAEDRYLQVDYDDWEGEDSVANEVLAALDMLDMNLIIPGDIPFYLEFLRAPRGQSEQARRKFHAARDAIDYHARQQMLGQDPLYAPFCR